MTAGRPGVRTWETSKETSPTTVPVFGSVSWHCWRPPLPTWHCTSRRQTRQFDSYAQVRSAFELAATIDVQTALQACVSDVGLMSRHACMPDSNAHKQEQCRCVERARDWRRFHTWPSPSTLSGIRGLLALPCTLQQRGQRVTSGQGSNTVQRRAAAEGTHWRDVLVHTCGPQAFQRQPDWQGCWRQQVRS